MKFKDIKVSPPGTRLADVTDYAISTWMSRRGTDPHRRGIVTEVRATRRVHTGARWDLGGHTAHDAVKVRLYDEKGKLGKEETISQKDVVMLWSEYVPIRERELAVKDNAETQRAERERRGEKIVSELRRMGIQASFVHKEYNPGSGNYIERNTIRLGLDAGEHLVEILDADVE